MYSFLAVLIDRNIAGSVTHASERSDKPAIPPPAPITNLCVALVAAT